MEIILPMGALSPWTHWLIGDASSFSSNNNNSIEFVCMSICIF